MRNLLLFLTLCFTFLASSTLAFADDDCKCEDDPRCCFGEFEDDDSITTESKKAERTFSLPPLKAGFVIDVYNRDLLPHITIGLKEFTISQFGNWGDFSIDVGVATSRVFTSLTWEIIPIVKIGPMLWGGYNVKENDAAFGIGFSMLDF